MTSQEVEVLVVGAGQAGVAMSEHLSERGIPHIVLERHRIAERWRTMRWDSLVANGPAWHDRFPGLEFTDIESGSFPSKEQVADYFAAYAEKIGAPIRCGVEVTSVRRNVGAPGFQVQTSDGEFNARYVVAATGPFQRPVIPAVVPETAGVMQMHSSSYRNPDQLPEGAVLVVGAGSSGVQIAAEIQRSGRQVLLVAGSAGQVGRFNAGGGCGARNHRGEWRRRWPHRRLPRARGEWDHPGRAHYCVR
jgi:putative flavoprotein involved in K+ transport